MSSQRIGFVGVGLMGSGMASCLLADGYSVSLLAHRNRAPVERLIAQGAGEAPDPATLVQSCDVVFTCLPNAEAVEAFAGQVLAQFRHGQIWIDTSTSRPEVSEAMAERLHAKGVIFADAPVTGGPEQAQEGSLSSLVGCAEQHFSAVETLVGSYSKLVRRFGEPGRGHAAKLLNNLVSQGTAVLLSDAFQCARKTGVDSHALFEIMMAGAARSGTLEKTVPAALEGRFDSSKFTIGNSAKDLRYARDLVNSVAPERTALAGVIADRLSDLETRGRGGDYISTLLDPEKS